MLPLTSISRIGFGCHLVSVDCQEHYDALLYALASGCNLLDTSANYMRGKSEQLIGKVLQENPQYDAFIVTKSGYDENEHLFRNNEGGAWNEIIHPDFLRNRIKLSLSRLRKKTIDGFLLHSPESYLTPEDIQPFPDAFYVGIKQAFEFLEEQTSEGLIRYYGISSNTFHLSSSNADTIDLHRVLSIANDVSSSNHFKLIEFPFNLGEMDALENNQRDASLIGLAHENKVVTLTNRPLNAKTAIGPVRLAMYKEHEALADYVPDPRTWRECLALIKTQLTTLGVTDDVMEFAIVKHLNESWTTIGNPEGVVQMFQGFFYPFLNHIYEGSIPCTDEGVYRKFYESAMLCSKRMMALRTNEYRNMLVKDGKIQRQDERPLPVIACDIYLKSGIDHVLVGMKKKEYVEMMKPLFYQRNASRKGEYGFRH